jgi:hypothetical protein
MAEHGTTTRYRDGCRCENCRAANRRKARRSYENRRAPETAPEPEVTDSAKVLQMKPNQTPATGDGMGETEQAVRAEFSRRDPDNEHPVERALAIRLSQVLDNSRQMDKYSAASKELNALRTSLFGERRRKSGGRLSKVSRMAGPQNVREA